MNIDLNIDPYQDLVAGDIDVLLDFEDDDDRTGKKKRRIVGRR